MATTYNPRLCYTEAERESARNAYLAAGGPLYQRLLFKSESHRISVIGSNELFPIEWRLDAERTILPWELKSQLAIWEGYRREVSEGRHRPFLEQLYIYDRLWELVEIDLSNFIGLVESSETSTGSWATRPEVVDCRAAIMARPMITLPPQPRWPNGESESDISVVEDSVARLRAVVSAWNDVVQRGNKRGRLPKQPLAFDDWVASSLRNEWYFSFLDWVKPWVEGGYGLYRDCE